MPETFRMMAARLAGVFFILVGGASSFTSVPQKTFWGRSLQAASPSGGGGNLQSDTYTNLAWDAISSLSTLADDNKQQTVEAELLAKALLDQGNKGVAQRLLS